MILVSPAKVLAHYLVSIGAANWYVNSTTVWPVTWSKMPDDPPIKRIALFDSGKVLLQAYQRTGGTPQKPLVQMLIRSEETQYDVAYVKGEGLAGQDGVFDFTRDVIVTAGSATVKIKSIRSYIPFTPVGQEPTTKNWRFTANVRLHLEGV